MPNPSRFFILLGAFVLAGGTAVVAQQAPADSARKMQRIAEGAATKVMQCCSSLSFGGASATIDFQHKQTFYNVKANRVSMYMVVHWKGTFSDKLFQITGVLTSDLNGCHAQWKPMAHSKGLLGGCSRGCLNALDCYGED
jgi:hypothetical protein